MHLFKKTALVFCIALMPIKASAVGWENLLNYAANGGVAVGIVTSGIMAIVIGCEAASKNDLVEKCFAGLCGLACRGCTLHSGREVYRLFTKPQQPK